MRRVLRTVVGSSAGIASLPCRMNAATTMLAQSRGAFVSTRRLLQAVAAAAPTPSAPAARSIEVTSGTFDTEVIQSQIAVCVVFHCNSYECKQHIKRLEDIAAASNTASKYHWLKITSVDADRHSNMASAFSVERNRLPMTFFAVSGTIIDKISGKNLPHEKLEVMVGRFRDYYQKSKGVELVDHGAFVGAKPEKLTERAPTDALEAQLVALLVTATAVSHSNEEDLRAVVGPVLDKALKQSKAEVDELRASLGVDVKKMEEERVVKALYQANAYIGAAHVAALHALYLARLAAIVGDTTAAAAVEGALSRVSQEYAGAAGGATIRRVTARAELILTDIACRAFRARAEQSILAANNKSATDGVEAVAAVACKRVQKMLDVLDGSGSTPPALQAELLDPVITDIKALTTAARTAKQRESVEGGLTTADLQGLFKVVKRAILAVLAMYPDDPVALKFRARLASLLY